jgi:saccharopine dehydrogenase (NAD+, L-lysine forming)
MLVILSEVPVDLPQYRLQSKSRSFDRLGPLHVRAGMSARGILIVGGYGVIGRRIAVELAVDYSDQITIAGRNGAKAAEAAAATGRGARGRQIDTSVATSVAAALEGVAIVISCIDLPDRALLWAAIERGLCYTDITPRLTELGRGAAYERVDAAARSSGARVVLGTGIAPGIVNVMARALTDPRGRADEIETALLLPAGDSGGPALLGYFLQELAMSYEIRVQGADRPARAFSDPRLVEFPPPAGARLAYLFPFSDQVLYPRTLGASTAVTRLAVDPAWLGRFLAMMVSTGASRLTAIEWIRNAIMNARRGQNRPSAKEAWFELRVDVRCGDRLKHATLVGQAQADATALAAAETARLLIEGNVSEPGAWMPEQVIDPGPFFAHLASRGLRVEFSNDC